MNGDRNKTVLKALRPMHVSKMDETWNLELAVRRHLESALRAHHGHVSQTAKALGVSRDSVMTMLDWWGPQGRDLLEQLRWNARATRRDRKREELLDILRRHRGCVAKVAREMNVHPRTIHDYLSRYDLCADMQAIRAEARRAGEAPSFYSRRRGTIARAS